MRALVAAALLILLAAPAVGADWNWDYTPSPSGLEAIGGDGIVTLKWYYWDPADYPYLDHFRIYRSVDNARTFCFYDTITWTGPNRPTYVDREPSSGPYVNAYYVTAVNVFGEESLPSNTAAATPTSGGVYNPPCTGGGGGGGPGGGGDPGDPGSGGDPGGGDDDGSGDAGGGSGGGGGPGSGGGPGGGYDDGDGDGSCDICVALHTILEALWDLYYGLLDVEDAVWVVYSAVRDVEQAVWDLEDYLRYPNAPVPSPPDLPLGDGYRPPPAPDLTPVMPQLGQRTGRPAPTVPTLYVPPDLPPPPALPPVVEPSRSPWGLPIHDPLEAAPALSPDSVRLADPPSVAQPPVAAEPAAVPGAPLQAEPPLPATTAVVPEAPLSPAPARPPSPVLDPASPLRPDAPLVPDPPLYPGR